YIVAPSSVVISCVRKSPGNGMTSATAGNARASAARAPTRTLTMVHLLRLGADRPYKVPSGWKTELAVLGAGTAAEHGWSYHTPRDCTVLSSWRIIAPLMNRLKPSHDTVWGERQHGAAR